MRRVGETPRFSSTAPLVEDLWDFARCYYAEACRGGDAPGRRMSCSAGAATIPFCHHRSDARERGIRERIVKIEEPRLALCHRTLRLGRRDDPTLGCGDGGPSRRLNGQTAPVPGAVPKVYRMFSKATDDFPQAAVDSARSASASRRRPISNRTMQRIDRGVERRRE